MFMVFSVCYVHGVQCLLCSWCSVFAMFMVFNVCFTYYVPIM